MVAVEWSIMFASVNKKYYTMDTFLFVFFFMISLLRIFFSILTFSDFFLYLDHMENFIGSDPCPNYLQGYKQRTLPNESAINVSIYM